MRQREQFRTLESISNFHNGQYAVWTLQGNFDHSSNPVNFAGPLVSALLFGPA